MFLRFLRNMAGYVLFEIGEYVASGIGIIAVGCFIVVMFLSFNFFADQLSTTINLLVSSLIALVVSLVPGSLAVWLRRWTE